MNNETTASQPKSIGDDAQFLDLLEAWHIGDAEGSIKPFDDLIAHIDNFRAPAAQASATIQAAPEGTAMQRYKECSGDDEPSALERLRFFCSLALNGRDWLDSENFFSDLAAVIQEPVMVAELVGVDSVIGWITTGDLEGDEVGDWDIEWDRKKIDGMPEFCQPETTYDVYLRVAPAAPMVADPAGVDTQWPPMPDPIEARDHGHGLYSFDQVQTYARAAVDLAATVKAVPSEALDEILERAANACMRAVPDRAHVRRIGEAAHYIACAAAVRALKSDAAPLADKTGGGE